MSRGKNRLQSLVQFVLLVAALAVPLACAENTIEGDKLLIGPDVGKADTAGMGDLLGGTDDAVTADGLLDVAVVDPDAEGSDATGSDPDAIPGDAAQVCPPNTSGCTEDGKLATCNADGTAYETKSCEANEKCLNGKCIRCTQDSECDSGLKCVGGQCVAESVVITTDSVPPGFTSKPYSLTFAATGGVLPYTWSIPGGLAPPGLSLSTDGVLTGTPGQTGKFGFLVEVLDKAGQKASRQYIIDISTADVLTITTTSPLKQATEGQPYSLQFEVKGGTPPYAWLVSGGSLPTGLTLSADGKLTGTPTTDKTGSFTLKVFDSSAQTLQATKDFELPIKLAPLQIVGSQEINLFITKVIVLPLIVVVDNIPVPYNAKLEATGGKKPYSWQEVPLPGFVANFLGGKSGVPKGLTIAKDGTISGGVSDSSLVLSLNVPIVNINLTGFFFQAQVTDSQSAPASQEALFIIPTVPIGN